MASLLQSEYRDTENREPDTVSFGLHLYNVDAFQCAAAVVLHLFGRRRPRRHTFVSLSVCIVAPCSVVETEQESQTTATKRVTNRVTN